MNLINPPGRHPIRTTRLPALQIGRYAAIVLSVLTAVTFGLAILAIPISGTNCRVGCHLYPYLDTLAQFPHDYIWMLPAQVLVVTYLVVMVSIYEYADREQKIYGQLGLSFALIAAAILLSAYYLQLTVVPVSLSHGETAGIPLLIQYNPHGVFIALEEIGYLLMSLSLFCVAPVFAHHGRVAAVVRWLFTSGFLLIIGVLVVMSLMYGIDREDRFEVPAITISWFMLLIGGGLLSRVFGQQRTVKRAPRQFTSMRHTTSGGT
jgi:hypothetical protein